MFVRWQKRKRKSRAFGGGRDRADTHWAAILAESARVNGKPTQQHVAYLGGITDSAIEIAAQRAYFWASVAQQLDRLGSSTCRSARCAPWRACRSFSFSSASASSASISISSAWIESRSAFTGSAVAASQRGSAAMKNKLCVRSTDALRSSHQE